MKKFLSILSYVALVFFMKTAAAEVLNQVPDTYCDPEWYNCADPAKQITSNYWLAGTPDLTADQNLYSGACYMVNSSLAPDHQHWGYVYLSKLNGVFHFFGEFSFFDEVDPNADLTYEKAESNSIGQTMYDVFIAENAGQSVMFPEIPWQYFFRQAGEHLYVIGFWGINDSITCDLTVKPRH